MLRERLPTAQPLFYCSFTEILPKNQKLWGDKCCLLGGKGQRCVEEAGKSVL